MRSHKSEFSISDEEVEESIYALGVNVSGPTREKEARKNIVLTLLADVSDSMDSRYTREIRSDIKNTA